MKSKNYEEFVEKFKPKKTTDDCYTPPLVYDKILNVCQELFDISSYRIVRPFYPGGDFENFKYPDNAIVLDNPPFSILKNIVEFYVKNNIKFILFCPGLCAFTKYAMQSNLSFVFFGDDIAYENGAKVNTGLVTNIDEGHVYYKHIKFSHTVKITKKPRPVGYVTPCDVEKMGKRAGKDLKLHYDKDSRLPGYFSGCIKIIGGDV